jgi:hypothetical protein
MKMKMHCARCKFGVNSEAPHRGAAERSMRKVLEMAGLGSGIIAEEDADKLWYPSGLPNSKNFCFLNSTLQAMASLRLWMDFLQEISGENTVGRELLQCLQLLTEVYSKVKVAKRVVPALSKMNSQLPSFDGQEEQVWVY